MKKVSISLPDEIVNKIDLISNKEKRNRSNMINFILEDYIDWYYSENKISKEQKIHKNTN